jgi:thiosulfate dehydrogenase
MKGMVALISAFTAATYVGAIVIGLHVKNLSFTYFRPDSTGVFQWEPPSLSSIPADAQGESIQRGREIFEDTAQYAPRYTYAKVSCGSCHAGDGIQPYAIPMVGLPALFPMYNKRAGRVISLRERIEECFVRSENGKPLPYSSTEMQAIVDYIQWLSQPEPNRDPFVGRGLSLLPDLQPDARRGSIIYAEQCAGCHGEKGEGTPPEFPPLWGAYSFNDQAGMNDIQKMARFVYHNMPQNRMGILTAQDAFDVAAYIHQQPRPKMNPAYKKF